MMQRCQLYLNPQAIKIIDQYAKHYRISRSRLIRQTIDQLSQVLAEKLSEKSSKSMPNFNKLIGAINFDQVTNLAMKSDKDYLG